MTLRFRLIGHDPGSKNSDSPTAWIEEGTGRLMLQGPTIDDPEILAALVAASDKHHGFLPPDHETVIAWPPRMLPILKEIVNAYEALNITAADGDGPGGS